ncbi:MAG: phosphoribosyl-ATP diphosphatase [Alphaproteobacteria bacterium]|nr:MAG: phosphoribosyl-ATP diphosphatase [Alphaproteobacteria bacterium]
MDRDDILARLVALIRERRGGDPEKSYVARLLADGRAKAARKFGEEAVELTVAALAESRESVIGEAADALFHYLVLLEALGVGFEEVLAELERREGISGMVEKSARRREKY